MLDGFSPQTSHDFLYNKRLLGFLLLIPVTRESKLLQTIGTRRCVLLVVHGSMKETFFNPF